jgi:hypothetical protein
MLYAFFFIDAPHHVSDKFKYFTQDEYIWSHKIALLDS